MHREIRLTDAPLDGLAQSPPAPSPGTTPPAPEGDHPFQSLATAGAALTFLGIVRGDEAGQPIAALDYEAFVPMAEHQFGKLFDTLEGRWPAIESVRLIHRLGRVPVGEASLWIEVRSPHRAEAFAACQWLIDEMKRVVPIWKTAVHR